MIIQFELDLGIEKTTGWARREGVEPYQPLVPIVVDAPEGTPGQAFQSVKISFLSHVFFLISVV